jgi:hypothetical protein
MSMFIPINSRDLARSGKESVRKWEGFMCEWEGFGVVVGRIRCGPSHLLLKCPEYGDLGLFWPLALPEWEGFGVVVGGIRCEVEPVPQFRSRPSGKDSVSKWEGFGVWLAFLHSAFYG